jgi:hypothetical protein
MYDWLLFLHLLAAFSLGVTTVMFSAFALGAPIHPRSFNVANALWGIGGAGTLVFGIWLALDVDGYEVWDAWVIAALVLWFFAYGAAEQARMAIGDLVTSAPGVLDDAARRRLAATHWIRTALVVALLIVMIWKPAA